MQANLSDDGAYGLATVPNFTPYVEKTVGPEGIKVAILGIGNHRVPNYELPSNIPGLTFTDPLVKSQELSDQLRASNDVVLALTHIGFTENPSSVEVDKNVDTDHGSSGHRVGRHCWRSQPHRSQQADLRIRGVTSTCQQWLVDLGTSLC